MPHVFTTLYYSWVAFEGLDFHGVNRFLASNPNEIERCNNATVIQVSRSLRRLGGPETTIPTISLYEGSAEYSLTGREVYVDGVAFAQLPFSPKAYAFTGSVNWTVYEGSNFDGHSTCLTPNTPDITFGQFSEVVGSVIRSCGLEAQENIAKILKRG
jgi:hypothetical protein